MGVRAKTNPRLKRVYPPKLRHRRAVFLDRDGTLIHYVPHLHRISQVRLFKDAGRAIRLLKEAGFLIVVITNQPAVARGFLTRKDVRQVNRVLLGRLKKQGAHVDAVYFCPHEHKDNCSCRKPKLGMVREAQRKFGIDFKKSFFVGDDMRDVETGRRGKMKTILLKTGMAGRDKRFFDVRPDFKGKNLWEAARIIKKLDK